MNKANPVFPFIYELHVTVNVYRAECSLSLSDSHFFPHRKNVSSSISLNVFVTNPEHIESIIMISNDRESNRFNQNWS